MVNARDEGVRERLTIVGLLLLGLVSRAIALPASVWEWDDIDFSRAIHRFDIAAHSPHPPGFPVFVAMTRLAWLVVRDDHHALLAVNYIFASLLGVVVYLLFRQFMPDWRLALAGAILTCFAPTLWIHSGIARTDNPSLVTGLTVLWLLLRGRTSTRSLLGGAFLLGLGMGIRVTIVPLCGVVFALVLFGQLRRRRVRVTALAIGLVGLGFLIWFVPLILETGWGEYNRLMKIQSAYISEHDPVWSRYWTLDERLNGFFVRIWGAPWILWSVYLFAAFGIFALLWRRHWRTIGWMAACFVPFLAFTVIYNTPMGVVVYSMAYIPLFTGLAASGMVLFFDLARILTREIPNGEVPMSERLAVEGRPAAPPSLWASSGLLLTIAWAGCLAWWSYPVTSLLHRQPSPPVKAARSLLKRVDPRHDKIYFTGLLLPHATYFFDKLVIEEWMEDEILALNLIDPGNRDYRRFHLLSTEPIPGLSTQRFKWSDGVGLNRLKPLSIGRYFDIYLSEVDPARNLVFGSGWYDIENSGLQNWRWMGQQSQVALFNDAEKMRLRINGRLPGHLPKSGDSVHLKIDGREIARLTGPEVEFSSVITTLPDQLWSRLTLEVDRTFVPKSNGLGNDERELGFQCFNIGWEVVDSQNRRVYKAEQFLGEGWGPLQLGRPRSWRWAEKRAVVDLPARTRPGLPAGDGHLRMIFFAQALPDGRRATIRVSIDGRVIDTFSPEPEKILTREWSISTSLCPNGRCQLTFETDQSTNHGAFKVTSLSWVP